LKVYLKFWTLYGLKYSLKKQVKKYKLYYKQVNFIKIESNMDEIQKKIVNLLDYINASEYAKDLEVKLENRYL
jgi:hypothetical protein